MPINIGFSVNSQVFGKLVFSYGIDPFALNSKKQITKGFIGLNDDVPESKDLDKLIKKRNVFVTNADGAHMMRQVDYIDPAEAKNILDKMMNFNVKTRALMLGNHLLTKVLVIKRNHYLNIAHKFKILDFTEDFSFKLMHRLSCVFGDVYVDLDNSKYSKSRNAELSLLNLDYHFGITFEYEVEDIASIFCDVFAGYNCFTAYKHGENEYTRIKDDKLSLPYMDYDKKKEFVDVVNAKRSPWIFGMNIGVELML